MDLVPYVNKGLIEWTCVTIIREIRSEKSKVDLRVYMRFLKAIFYKSFVPDQNQLNNLKNLEKWLSYLRSKVRRYPNLGYEKINGHGKTQLFVYQNEIF